MCPRTSLPVPSRIPPNFSFGIFTEYCNAISAPSPNPPVGKDPSRNSVNPVSSAPVPLLRTIGAAVLSIIGVPSPEGIDVCADEVFGVSTLESVGTSVTSTGSRASSNRGPGRTIVVCAFGSCPIRDTRVGVRDGAVFGASVGLTVTVRCVGRISISVLVGLSLTSVASNASSSNVLCSDNNNAAMMTKSK